MSKEPLDLEAIRARNAGRKWDREGCEEHLRIINECIADIDALLAECERLRALTVPSRTPEDSVEFIMRMAGMDTLRKP